MLSSEDIKIIDLLSMWPELTKIPNILHSQLETDCRYNIYLKRQQEDINAFKKENAVIIPVDFDFSSIKGLSNEIRDILYKVKPQTIAQASKLPGFTPTATLLLLRFIKRNSNSNSSWLARLSVL